MPSGLRSSGGDHVSVSERIGVGPLGRPNRTYPFGRVCAADRCRTGPSIHNGSEYCWVHEPIRFPRVAERAWRVQAA
jgi:hypothetical protein